MKRIMVIGEFPSPYRVDVFNILNDTYQLKVYFEMMMDEKREENWLLKDEIPCHILNNWDSFKSYIWDLLHLKKYDAVILYNNCMKYAMILETVCKRCKVPYFINCDGCNDIEERNPVKKVSKIFLMRGAAGYFAGGTSARKYFEYFGAPAGKIYIHNFTSLHGEDIETSPIGEKEKFELKRDLGVAENFSVITVGRHIACKGFDIILQAAQKLGTAVGFYIVGGAPSKENLAYKETHQLANVHFIEFQDRKRLKRFYLSSDVFVLMTRGDTWGLVVNEAMANGLPVITTKRCVAGVELVEDDINGYIIDVDDTDSLVQRILKLENNLELRRTMSQNNIVKMQNNTVDQIAANHIKILDKFFHTCS